MRLHIFFEKYILFDKHCISNKLNVLLIKNNNFYFEIVKFSCLKYKLFIKIFFLFYEKLKHLNVFNSRIIISL